MALKPLGILMLDSLFDRLLGDIGNPATWSFPVRYHVVPHATPARVVNDTSDPELLQRFLDGADALMRADVCGITTTCGFLGLHQRALAEHCSVPVATSALLQVAQLDRMLPATQRVGILSFRAEALTDDHLQAVGVALDTPRLGFSATAAFTEWILTGRQIPLAQLESEVLAVAAELCRLHPEVGAIVSECTNLTPFARSIRRHTGRPVYDMLSLVHWFRHGLYPPSFNDDTR